MSHTEHSMLVFAHFVSNCVGECASTLFMQQKINSSEQNWPNDTAEQNIVSWMAIIVNDSIILSSKFIHWTRKCNLFFVVWIYFYSNVGITFSLTHQHWIPYQFWNNKALRKTHTRIPYSCEPLFVDDDDSPRRCVLFKFNRNWWRSALQQVRGDSIEWTSLKWNSQFSDKQNTQICRLRTLTQSSPSEFDELIQK